MLLALSILSAWAHGKVEHRSVYSQGFKGAVFHPRWNKGYKAFVQDELLILQPQFDLAA